MTNCSRSQRRHFEQGVVVVAFLVAIATQKRTTRALGRRAGVCKLGSSNASRVVICTSERAVDAERASLISGGRVSLEIHSGSNSWSSAVSGGSGGVHWSKQGVAIAASATVVGGEFAFGGLLATFVVVVLFAQGFAAAAGDAVDVAVPLVDQGFPLAVGGALLVDCKAAVPLLLLPFGPVTCIFSSMGRNICPIGEARNVRGTCKIHCGKRVEGSKPRNRIASWLKLLQLRVSKSYDVGV